MHRLIDAALTCALSIAAPAVTLAAEPNNLLTDYALASWHEADGRPLGAVYAIAQSADGYLWVGSDAGLFRFDGSRFLEWSAMSEAPLPQAAVTALCVARDGTLWVALAGAGIRRIRNGQLLDADSDAFTPRRVVDVVEDQQGTIWTVADGELYARTGDRWRRVTLPWTAREGRVLQALVGPSGDVWAATRWGTFVKRAGDDAFVSRTSGFIWGISEGAGRDVWTTDIAAGFRRLDDETPPQSEHHGAGHRLIHDHQGNLWIGTFSEGLWRTDVRPAGAQHHVDRADLRTGLLSDSVQALAEDRDGNVWVGTTGGLHRFTRRALTPVDNIGFVVTVEPADDGRAWICRTNGVALLSPDRDTWPRLPSDAPGPDIRSLYRDPQGTLWVGAAEGLFQSRNGRLVEIEIGRDDVQVLSILPAAGGGLWLADGEWLYRWDGRRLHRFDASHFAPDATRIVFSAVDRQGRLWLQFPRHPIAYVDRDGSYHEVPIGDAAGGRHEDVLALYDTGRGTIWIGGSVGLSRFAQGRLQRIGTANGLPPDRIWSIVDDQRGHLWLSVDRGIIRLDPADVDKALSDPSYRLRYRLYDALDGLAGASVGVIHAIRASDGRLWFVRGGGLTLLDPDRLADDRDRASPVQIDMVVANDRRSSATPSARFPSGTRRLQINYTALTLGTPNRIRFRYRLEGVDTDWVDAGARRGTFYTNLSPRDYRFEVQAVAEEGNWNVSTAAWNFTIEPAFYQTRWFAVLCVAAFGAALWGAWWLRVGMMQRQFSLVLAERARMSREIHDTLLQSLVGVMLQFDAIARSVAAASPGARDQLLRLRRRVEAHIRDARQSIHNLRSPLLDCRDLPKALIDFGTNAVADTPVTFTGTIHGTPRKCPPEFESQLLRIGQEAIVNAVRHARPREIRLDLHFDERSVVLEVTDDGCGFAYDERQAETDDHYGLTMMRERAEQLDSDFSIASQVGRGTTVRVRMPIRGVPDALVTVDA